MKLETKIAYLILCLALPLTTACKKTPIPAEDPQPAEIGFTAASQAVWVKGGSTAETPEFPHDDFGVWGIARQGNLVYNLWGNQSLTDVNKNTTTGYYEPEEAAYWMAGYTYNFLAVAPYNDAGFSFGEIKTKESQATATPAVDKPVDCLTFTYDISNKYNNANYTFDLLGAAVETGSVSGGRTAPQDLTFWHLLSQVNIGVSFTTDLEGKPIEGKLTKIKLKDICTRATSNLYYVDDLPFVQADWVCHNNNKMDCEYSVSQDVELTIKADQADATVTLTAGKTTITSEDGEASITVPRGTFVTYAVEGTDEKGESKIVEDEIYVHRSLIKPIHLSSSPSKEEPIPDWTINIIPQDVKLMTLLLDFEISGQTYTDFQISLNVAGNAYEFNGKYNWNISIGTGAAIKFEVVDVTDWTTVDGGDISM